MYNKKKEAMIKKLETELKYYLSKDDTVRTLNVIKKANKQDIVLNETFFKYTSLEFFAKSLAYNEKEVAVYLLDNYMDVNVQLDKINPMTIAIKEGNFEIMQLLEKRGIELNKIITQGNSAFMIACESYFNHALYEEGIKYAINYMNPDLLLKNDNGKRALEIVEPKYINIQLINKLKEKTLQQEEIKKINTEKEKLEAFFLIQKEDAINKKNKLKI